MSAAPASTVGDGGRERTKVSRDPVTVRRLCFNGTRLLLTEDTVVKIREEIGVQPARLNTIL